MEVAKDRGGTVSEDSSVVRERKESSEEPGLRDHLDDISDGSGCAEIWEHLENRRREEQD